MAIDPKTRMKVEAELRLGKTAKSLSEKYDIPYVTINYWNKQLKSEQVDADVNTLMDYDSTTVHSVAENLVKEAPLPEVKKVEKLVKDVDGLKRLEEKTREISMAILSEVQVYMVSNECNLRELKDAATIVTAIHNAIFNKANTQINVMNNSTTNISSEKREIFKSSLKA